MRISSRGQPLSNRCRGSYMVHLWRNCFREATLFGKKADPILIRLSNRNGSVGFIFKGWPSHLFTTFFFCFIIKWFSSIFWWLHAIEVRHVMAREKLRHSECMLCNIGIRHPINVTRSAWINEHEHGHQKKPNYPLALSVSRPFYSILSLFSFLFCRRCILWCVKRSGDGRKAVTYWVSSSTHFQCDASICKNTFSDNRSIILSPSLSLCREWLPVSVPCNRMLWRACKIYDGNYTVIYRWNAVNLVAQFVSTQ